MRYAGSGVLFIPVYACGTRDKSPRGDLALPYAGGLGNAGAPAGQHRGIGGRMGGMEHGNLLGGPPPTYLPEDPAAEELEYGVSPTDVAAAHPACLAAWAALS